MKKDQPDVRIRLMWIIHCAFIGATIIYGVVAYILKTSGGMSANQPSAVIMPVMLVLSIMSLAMGFVVPGIIVASRIQPDTSPGNILTARLIQMIVMDACFESIAIFGLAGMVVGMQAIVGYGLIAVSLVALASQSGRIGGWIDEYRRRVSQERSQDSGES